jgi:acyl phosphate:glycerol-3-phosphate acyltransferase
LPTTGALLMSAGGLLVAYLLGSLPFGYVLAHFKGVDIRAVGSGNIGATNVGRALGKSWGVLVFLLDAGKGFLAAGPLCWLVLRLGEVPGESLLSAGLGSLYAVAAFGGHVWPVFLGFKGGKGVATGAGAVAALAPVALAAGVAMWGVSLFMTRYMSIASMFGAVTVAGICVARVWRVGRMREDWPLWSLTLVLALLVIARHRSNIARLVRGEELKLGAGKSPAEPGTESAK